MKIKRLIFKSLIIGIYLGSQSYGQTIIKSSPLPEIWKKAGAKERLLSIEGAKVDADRMLVERIYGAIVSGKFEMGDLGAVKSDALQTSIQQSLIGASTKGEPRYDEKGYIEVTRTVAMRDVVHNLQKTTRIESSKNGKTSATKTKSSIDFIDYEFEAKGYAAIRGSLGHQLIMARRAAILDGYKEMAKKIASQIIQADTSTADKALKSDIVSSEISNLVKGSEITDWKFDETTEHIYVYLQLPWETFERIIKTSRNGDSSQTNTIEQGSKRYFQSTGEARMHQADDFSNLSATQENHNEEIETIVREIIQSGPVVR